MYGSRKSRHRWASNAAVTRSIPLPSGSEGIIIGKGGSNIKELQALSGIVFVNVRDGQLNIGGKDNASVDVVEFRVRSMLGPRPSKFKKQIHFDLDTNVKLVQFQPIHENGLVSFAHNISLHGGRMLSLRPVPDSLEDQIENLSIKSTETLRYKTNNATRLIHDPDAMVDDIKKILSSKLPDCDKRKIEVRFCGTAFHSAHYSVTSQMLQTKFPISRILKDANGYRTQFSMALNIPFAVIQQAFEKLGFEKIGYESVTVVAIEDVIKKDGYTAVFLNETSSTEESEDPRLSKEARRELERISKCSRANEILEVSSNPQRSEIMKAYKKKCLRVHPDKNGIQGSTQAMQFVERAKCDLLKSHNSSYKPTLFEIGNGCTTLPKLIKLRTKSAKLLVIDTVKVHAKDAIGARLEIASKGPAEKPSLATFLEKAWKAGEIVSGGKLSIDRSYNVEAVRIKNTTRMSDGVYDIELGLVQQKSTASLAQFNEFPEVTLKCGALKEAILMLEQHPENSSQLDTVLQMFRDYMEKADELAGIVSAIKDRITK